jgi:hypothetical protein
MSPQSGSPAARMGPKTVMQGLAGQLLIPISPTITLAAVVEDARSAPDQERRPLPPLYQSLHGLHRERHHDPLGDSKRPCADSLEVPQHGLVVALAGGLPRLGYFADRLVLLRLSLSFLLHGGPQPSELLGKNRSVLTTSTVRARSRLEASCCFFGEINDARHQSN